MWELITNNFIEIMCAGIASAATGVLVYCVRMMKGVMLSVKAMGHDKLYRFCRFYISTNEITIEELENLEHIYKGYATLGGNGTGQELFEKCTKLPIVEVRTHYNPYYVNRDVPHDYHR